MKIVGIDGMSPQDLDIELQRGCRFVIFTYCISIMILTFKRPSPIYLIKPEEGAVGRALPFTLISLALGGYLGDRYGRSVPWSPICVAEKTSQMR